MPNMPIEQDYAESVCEIKTMDNLLMAIGKVKEVTDKYVKLYSKKKELRIMELENKKKEEPIEQSFHCHSIVF